MKKLGVAMLLVVAGLVTFGLTSCNNDDGTPEEVLPAALTLRGEIVLNGQTNVRGGLGECVGAGQYADLYPGAPVVVTNAKGKPLTVGKILYAVGTNFYLNQLDQCSFKVDVGGVPRTDVYQFAFGRQDPVPLDFLSLVRSRGNFVFAFPPSATATTTTTTTTRA